METEAVNINQEELRYQDAFPKARRVNINTYQEELREREECVVWTEWRDGEPRPELWTAHVAQFSNDARRGEVQITPKLASKPVLCKTCKTPIMFVDTVNGKKLPLSLKTIRQDDQGNVFALNHFSDCPQAKRFRK